MTVTTAADYWISASAIRITLNALGEANRVQGSVTSGAVIAVYRDDVRSAAEGGSADNGDGLGYGADYQPRRWQLTIAPTWFNTDTAKYVYAAVPRSASVASQAVIVFPSEPLDIWGRNEEGVQAGSKNWFYIFLQGIISEVTTESGTTLRKWRQPISTGKLDTAQGNAERLNDQEWYNYSPQQQLVTFLKEIAMSDDSAFRNLKAIAADIAQSLSVGTSLTLNGDTLTGTAKISDTPETSADKIVTPAYLDEFGNTRYLSKVHDDTAAGKITFGQGLLFKQLLKSYGAVDGFQDGRGIIMDALRGLIQTDSLDVRGFMRVMELVINRLQLMESDYSFTEGDTTERVDFSDNGLRMVLTMHKEHDNDHTPFYPGDILYAKVNDLLDHGTYYTCWLRVVSVDLNANTVKVVPYPALKQNGDIYVPGAKNHTFLGTEIDGAGFDTELLHDYALYPNGYEKILNLTRHGNVADGLADGDDPSSYSASVLESQKLRQQAWVLSTTDKRLSFYWNVDEPIIRDENYALCLGILPDLANLPSTRNPDMPSLYVNTIFYDNQHAANYPAKVIKEDRGQWTANPTAEYNGTAISEPYHYKTFTNVTWRTYRDSSAWASLTDEQLRQKMMLEWKVDLEISRVWRYGALWECLVDGTARQPWFNSTDWQLISGGDFDMSITVSRRFLRQRDFADGAVGSTLGFTLSLGGEDIAATVHKDLVEWKRTTTGADTNPALAAADTAWNQNYGYHRLEIPVRSSDLPSNFWTVGEVKFTCYIDIDGLTEPVSASITIH